MRLTERVRIQSLVAQELRKDRRSKILFVDDEDTRLF
jgi:hypothetical protein